MNKTLKQLFEEAKELRLNPEEKAEGRRLLSDFISRHPVRSGNFLRRWFRSRSNTSQLTSAARRGTFLPLLKPMPAFLILMLLVGGGVTVGAEQSLPGDALYPVKVEVTEKVRSALALSPEAEAKLEAKLASRRLEEAEKLAAEGRLDAETQAKLEARFQKHADKVAERIDKFADKEHVKAEVSSNFETSLKVHDQILERLMSDKKMALPIRAKVKAETKDASEIRLKVEAEASTEGPNVQAAAEGKLKATEHKLSEVRNFLDKVKDRIDVQLMIHAEAKLTAAKNLVAEGRVKLEAGNHREAFVLFQRAHVMAQEAKLLVELRMKIDRPTPTPTVTPTPTPEERDDDKNEGSGSMRIEL